MKKAYQFAIPLSLALLFMLGCALETKLADYQPKSAEEAEVVQFVTECDSFYQNKDWPKVFDCLHDDAKIRIDIVGAGFSRAMVSKPELIKYVEGGKGDIPERSGILNPKISMAGDRATIKFSHHEDSFIIIETWDLVKENEKWKITRSDWDWH